MWVPGVLIGTWTGLIFVHIDFCLRPWLRTCQSQLARLFALRTDYHRFTRSYLHPFAKEYQDGARLSLRLGGSVGLFLLWSKV